jgi:uncharacterized protein YkwD
MKRTLCVFLVLWYLAAVPHAFGQRRQHPPPPPTKPNQGATEPNLEERKKANRLYRLAHQENGFLRWDACLAGQAFKRAKYIVDQMDEHLGDERYFAHTDPRNEGNPAWRYVYSCYKDRVRCAGENLAQGDNTAELTHRNWMNSRKHRENITNLEYNRVGIACYNYICVELFAGL